MALGFPPKESDELKIDKLSIEESYVIALETSIQLNWKIGMISEHGFIAYNKFSNDTWHEEILIKFEQNTINITSVSSKNWLMDGGKNKNNITSFKSKFSEIRGSISREIALQKYESIKLQFLTNEDKKSLEPLSTKEKVLELIAVFVPKEKYVVTPILIIVNIALFFMMLISGVDVFQPSTESLLNWGANFRPLTLSGEWWRLLSSCFIHIGVFHIAMNMYALLYIGRILEPLLGRSRFTSAYLVTGIASSCISLFWNDNTVSAGASGAIFGMYGVFLAMLTTNLISKEQRTPLLKSIAFFVGFNLIIGTNSNIDNAGHIGGLVSGIIIGYAFYLSLMRPKNLKFKHLSTALISVFILIGSFLLISDIKPMQLPLFDKKMGQFEYFQQRALDALKDSENTTNEVIIEQLQTEGIPSWDSCMVILKEVDELHIPSALLDRNLTVKEYIKLRIESYELILKAYSENTNQYQTDISQLNSQIESIIDDLK